jgi:hypothetical protein
MIAFLLKNVLYPSPRITIDHNQQEQFDKLVDEMLDHLGGTIQYKLDFPKYHFLHYLSQKSEFVFHGSNNQEITSFEPRNQTLYNGKLTKAVFATTDSIWPVFYATFKRSSLIGSFRNGCLEYKSRRYHFYSLNESTMQNDVWTNGMVYILPRQPFSKSGNGIVRFDEWISQEYVEPIAKLPVTIDDFYFKDKVSTHRDRETLLTTWLLYKIRTLKAISKKTSNGR